MKGIKKPPRPTRKSPRLKTELITATGITSERNSSFVVGPRGIWSPSFGGGAPTAATVAASYGIPEFTTATRRFRNVPKARRIAPGTRQFHAATTATPNSETRYSPRGEEGMTVPMARSPSAITSTGQSLRVKVERRRQSPPNAMPAKIPAATPLASMSVVHERFAGESAPQLGERFVVDWRQVAHLEGCRAALLNKLLKRADDHWVELNSFVAIELIHRSLVADRLSIDAVRGHRLVSVRNDDYSRT